MVDFKKVKGKKRRASAAEVEPGNRFADRFPNATPLHQQGEWVEWKTVGQDLAGKFLGVQPFRNGHKTTMLTEEGKVVVFSTPAVLLDILKGVTVGTGIAIVFSGTKPATTRNADGSARDPIKLFEVYELSSR